MIPERTWYEYLLDHFEDYDYRRPKFDPARFDYSRPDNETGNQQRTFNIWWAIEQCWKTGSIGLEIGSGAQPTPWCLNIDCFSTDHHPVYNNVCHPQMVLRGDVRLPFENESFSLVLANHVVEHLEGDVVEHLRDWIRVLKPTGMLAIVLPDQAYNDVLKMDPSHLHAWTAQQFYAEVISKLINITDIVEFDTFKNNFSYNAVLRKR